MNYVTWAWWELVLDWLLRKMFKYRDISKYITEGGEHTHQEKIFGMPWKITEGNYHTYPVLYIRRYYISMGKKRNIFLHAIRRSDDDRDPHDHPWDFTSTLLWGSYEEYSEYGHFPLSVRPTYRGGPVKTDEKSYWRAASAARKRYHWGQTYSVKAEHTHKLTLERPVWTLVRAEKGRRHWGFWTKTGWVHWRKYLELEDSFVADHAEDYK